MLSTPTLQDAQALRQLMLADEHIMICFCGVDMEQDAKTRALQEAIQKIVRIKMNMGRNHQMSLARVQGSTLVVEQEFTKDVAALVAAVPEVLSVIEHSELVDLDVLLTAAARYFGTQQDVERQATSSFRLLLVYRHVKQSPKLHILQSDTPREVLNDPAFHLDVIYWYRDVPLEVAQNVFDQLCSYDNLNPLAKSYFLEVGGSIERLHQALVLVLSHPAHRLSQNAAEQLLDTWFSPNKKIDFLHQKQQYK